MDADDRSLPSPPAARREAIAERWYRALAHIVFSPLPAAEMRPHLAALTDQAIELLRSDTLDEYAAREIGARLAGMHLLHSEVLRQTLVVLGTDLVADLPPARARALQPRLIALLSAVAAGYLERASATVLREQETLRTALLAERERTAAALRESEARFRAIFADAAIGIVLVDLSGRPVEANPAVERMLGYSREELRGMVFTEVTHPDDVAADWTLFAALVAGRRDSYQMEKRYLHNEGHIVWGNLTVSLVRDASGTPQFTIGMVEDITERKGMATDLLDAQRRIAESRETERLRLARELHDSAVQHLLDINRHLAEERKRAGECEVAVVPIATVAAVQAKVQEVTAQLRDLVRELRPPGLEEFGLSAALEGYVAGLQREWRGEMPALTAAMDGDDTKLPLSVSLPLFRAAQEVLHNAFLHDQAQYLTLSLRIEPHEVLLTVRDDGVGFVVPTPLSSLANGNHFGLIGVAERVALAGGELTITTEPGAGTALIVRVPVPTTGGETDDGDDSCRDRG